MELDHAASPRVGQRQTAASTPVPRVNTGDDLPENAYDGQLVYDHNTSAAKLYDKDAEEWKSIGGLEFYAQDDPPTSAGYAAFWLDTAP